ncbi:tetratricopeptide repeat-containing sulfotransferase family protein [Pseudoxanthomonas sacheonensis]|uniref:tetratricopeptide repeat-containing sulfotransferase family protein n=1 Tax=Pseudoxanthomonas sacheonensis TaxID=443615 RepID=UPI0013D06506|nr:sulfotransferase [Pseudoxanthomonas sacheonensis]
MRTWELAERSAREGDLDHARTGYESLLRDAAWVLPARLRLSGVALAEGRVREATLHALEAYAAREPDGVLMEALCAQLIKVGELQAAVDCAASPAVASSADTAVLAGVGRLMNEQSLPDLALPLLQRAQALGDGSPALQYQMGLCRMYLGDLDAAQSALARCLAAEPGHPAALRLRSKLRRASPSQNNVEELRSALHRMEPKHSDVPLLHYALFKELDELGQEAAAWSELERGMRSRRSQLQYDASTESSLFDHLLGMRIVPETVDTTSIDGPVPIFIVGMPRSGTTLLERILGAHPDVADVGELRDFTAQLRWSCEVMGGPHLDLPLARAAESADWKTVGQRYLAHTQWHAGGKRFYTDKLPSNFINIGYIARALPQARILHLVREPMDTCFSNLKELFVGAYPHSYDQQEMAAHFLHYRRLMAHWHTQFPGRVFDVNYARLVAAPAEAAREVLEFCGLPWQPGVTAIEARAGRVATASAIQMREPIHQRYVGQWRRYGQWLAPLHKALAAGGLADLDDFESTA